MCAYCYRLSLDSSYQSNIPGRNESTVWLPKMIDAVPVSTRMITFLLDMHSTCVIERKS